MSDLDRIRKDLMEGCAMGYEWVAGVPRSDLDRFEAAVRDDERKKALADLGRTLARSTIAPGASEALRAAAARAERLETARAERLERVARETLAVQAVVEAAREYRDNHDTEYPTERVWEQAVDASRRKLWAALDRAPVTQEDNDGH